eukprot:jgi/Orpsp1_1/1190026/evm.model.d7180000076199.1
MDYEEIERSVENIKEIIKENSIVLLNNYFNNNHIQSEDFNNLNEILIYAIENGASIEVIQLILNHRKDKNLNIHVTIDECEKVPLFVAIAYGQWEIADELIKQQADINYSYEMNNLTYNVVDYMISTNLFNTENIKYLLEKDWNNDDHWELYCRFFSLQKIDYFNTVLYHDIHHLKCIFQTGGHYRHRKEEVDLKEIVDCHLIEKCMKTGNYDYIEKIISSSHSFNYHYINYREILREAINKYLTMEKLHERNNI